MLIYHAPIRVCIFINRAFGTERFGIHMTASIAPQVKFPAILAEGNPTAVAVNNGIIFPAERAYFRSVRDSHLTPPLFFELYNRDVQKASMSHISITFAPFPVQAGEEMIRGIIFCLQEWFS
jgi:hypothetical protein